jgi:hypothetical protein
MSVIAVNSITDAAGGNTATINNMTPTADSLQGFRNRLINSDMRIDQRNAGASVTPTAATYTLDRWEFYTTQASKVTYQQNAGGVTPPAGFKNYLGFTVGASANVTVGASDLFLVDQYIEGYNIADFGFGAAGASSVTLSFWVRSSLTGTFGGALTALSNNRSYPFTYTISAANTWEQKTLTIAGDTSGTWNSTNLTGLGVRFSLGCGSTYLGTSGAWASAAYFGATGQTQLVQTNGATFYITGVQLEAGSVATPFERRPYGTELQLAQRYFQKSWAIETAVGTATSLGVHIHGGSNVAGTTGYISGGSINFKVNLRTTPTVVLYWSDATGADQRSHLLHHRSPVGSRKCRHAF